MYMYDLYDSGRGNRLHLERRYVGPKQSTGAASVRFHRGRS